MWRTRLRPRRGGRCRRLTAEQRQRSLQVLPGFALVTGTAQQERRMERGNQVRAAILVDAAAHPRDRILALQQRARGEGAERDDDLRLHRRNLMEEERLALLHFVGLWIAVVGRP